MTRAADLGRKVGINHPEWENVYNKVIVTLNRHMTVDGPKARLERQAGPVRWTG